MNTLYSLAYIESNNEVNNTEAYKIVKRHDKSKKRELKKAIIAAIACLILLVGSIVAGKFVYVEFIGDIKMSLGCFPGMLSGGAFAMLCVMGLCAYLKRSKAKKEFSQPIEKMDPAFKNEITQDLVSLKKYYQESRNAQHKLKVIDINVLLDELAKTDLQSNYTYKIDPKRNTTLTALQVSTITLALLLAIGCFILWIHSVGQAGALGSSSFTRFDTLSLVGAIGISLVSGIGALLVVYLQHKKSPSILSNFG